MKRVNTKDNKSPMKGEPDWRAIVDAIGVGLDDERPPGCFRMEEYQRAAMQLDGTAPATARKQVEDKLDAGEIEVVPGYYRNRVGRRQATNFYRVKQ